MKKIITITILLIGVIFTFSKIKSKDDSKQWTKLMLNNIECLATPENHNVICFGMGCVDCPKDNRLVLLYSEF